MPPWPVNATSSYGMSGTAVSGFRYGCRTAFAPHSGGMQAAQESRSRADAALIRPEKRGRGGRSSETRLRTRSSWPDRDRHQREPAGPTRIGPARLATSEERMAGAWARAVVIVLGVALTASLRVAAAADGPDKVALTIDASK